MTIFLWLVFYVFTISVLAFNRSSARVWTVGLVVFLFLVSAFSHLHPVTLTVFWVVLGAMAAFLNIAPLRRILFSNRIFSIYRKVMPSMSQTESEALSAGDLDWTAEMFSGMPDWQKLTAMPANKLSKEEQEFLAGPVEKLCSMLSDWKVCQIDRDLPPEVWQHLKENGYFGLIIPKKYGGKEFSALAHAQIISKVASICVSAATTLSVPNSLGPAELLLHYGTEEQKNYYLPRLAKGEEIPCFALTSPTAGSDAGSIVDHGVVCKAVIDGKEQIAIRVNWNKRYITLAPMATIVGLAFKLYDPEKLLGDKEEIGITCALIPANTKGVTTGRRHLPLTSAFLNGPTQGKDVLMPLDWVIGGKDMVGHGWRMLMECLAAGRGISLPSMISGGTTKAVYSTGAYARIRRQFNTYVGNFGGVQEALTNILGYTYIEESLRLFTIAQIDQGLKPVVASAVSKYHATEFARKIVNHAMDVHGGKGICLGPNNYLGQGYMEAPVSITVEGANILTRSMIIFGQGAIRCHPYVFAEIKAAQNPDRSAGEKAFDKAFMAHLGFIGSNKARAFWLAVTGGRLALTPKSPLKRYYQLLTRYSAAFALCADVAMLVLGGSLKRRERLSARLGDMLSYLYMGAAVLKHYEVEKNDEALEVAKWCCEYLLWHLQDAMDNFLVNFPNRIAAVLLRKIVFPFGKHLRLPRDKDSKALAKLMLVPSKVRHRISQHVYTGDSANNPIRYIQEAFLQAIEVEPLLKKLSQAKKQGLIKGLSLAEQVELARRAHILTEQEAQSVLAADELKMKVINVDDFANEELVRHWKEMSEAAAQ